LPAGAARCDNHSVQVQKDGKWELVCDVCKSPMIIGPAANPSPRMPSGWLNHGNDRHTCAVCSRLTVNR
jgi:hypothetical protein